MRELILNNRKPMAHCKSRVVGRLERLSLPKERFPDIERHVTERPAGDGVVDLLDSAAAAWTGLRTWQAVAESVCIPERHRKGMAVLHSLLRHSSVNEEKMARIMSPMSSR